MGTVTVSAIKADVGGYVGHGDVHPDLLAEARSRVREDDDVSVAVDTRALHFFDPETGLGIYDDTQKGAAR